MKMNKNVRVDLSEVVEALEILTMKGERDLGDPGDRWIKKLHL